MQETRLRLHLALGAARMSTWDATVVDSKVIDGVVWWSPDGAALIGLAPVEQQQTFPDFLARVHPDERGHLLDYMQRRVNQGAPYHIEYRILMPDGMVRWIGCRGMSVYEDGIPVRTLGLIWDDSARKQQEADLAEQKELAEVTLGSIGDGVIATDARGRIRFMNRVAEQLTSWNGEQAAGIDVAHVVRLQDEADGTDIENPVHRCLRERHAVGVSSHAQLLARDGRRMAAAGISWTVGDWDLDTSLVYGQNRMNYDVVNTLNASYGAASKTSFDAGGFSYNQLVYNLTGVRKLDVGGLASPLNVALGVEARREGYELHAGEPTSWNNGGVRVNGAAAASGAQVFPGFRPQNASDSSRTALGVFADLEANLTDKLLASAALRGERYNDFGSNLSGKLSGRYDFAKAFALRGAVQNGFRAPSLQQQNFTSTSTNFIDGIPYEITTFKPSDPVAVALGAKPLKAEKSTNYSLGAVLRFDPVSITVDAYRINVRDRIVLSENLTSVAVRNYIVSQGFAGVGGGRFFINGVSTRSEGVDVVANLPWNAGAVGRFDFTLAGNVNRTKVTKVPTTAQLAALNPAPVLFDRVNVLTLEQGQPKNKIVASANWKLAQWGVTARATRYGKVLSPGTVAANDIQLEPRTIVDLEGRIALTKQLSLAVGADNLFDQYSETLPFRVNTTNNAPFSNYTPFGNSGRYIYARANYTF